MLLSKIGLVLSVNKVANGTSQSSIDDIKELSKLRETANQLNHPNELESINVLNCTQHKKS